MNDKQLKSSNNPVFTGTQINYFFVCHRKLWFFSHNLQMEHESDTVFIGKMIGEESYDRRKKEIDIGGVIVLDSFDRQRGVIHEVKKSRAIEKAHIWQVKYYIYFLKRLGIETHAEIEYPLLKRKETIHLSAEDEINMEKTLNEIQRIVSAPDAPRVNKKSICRKCSYFELCYV